MSVLLVTLLLAAADPAQAPQAAPPQTADQPKKTKQVCEKVQVTGSRSPKRVCHDVGTDVVLLPGVSNNAYGKGSMGAGLGDPSNTPQ